jgi:mRNA-degrading endonuclease RelE of RelBE toxin-antitoxin system
MSFEIKIIHKFEKELKALVKKYPSLKTEYHSLITLLENQPYQGTAIGQEYYKIRIAIASKNKGKRGGGRVIICIKILSSTVYMLTIYDKSHKEDLAKGELKAALKEAGIKT